MFYTSENKYLNLSIELYSELLMQVLGESKDSKAQKLNWLTKEQTGLLLNDSKV